MKNHRTLFINREGILDYTGGPNVITRVFKSRQELRARAEDVMMEAEMGVILHEND